jgi:thiol-disulfide isomerase/thioredoxin
MVKSKTLTIILFSLLFLIPAFFAGGQTDKNATINFFWSTGCPHCQAEKSFLEDLSEKYPQIEIRQHEFSKNIELVKEFYENYQVPSREQGLVPITFTANSYFVGYNEQIGQEIEKCAEECLIGETEIADREIEVPLLGEIKIEEFSLPLLAVVLGTLDGFNICSLGALVLILGLVLALKSRKEILVFGGIFVLTTIIVYGLLVLLWHQIFVYLAPQIRKMELLIGLLALASAVYFFKEFLNTRKGKAVCKFGGISNKMSERIQRIFVKKANILAMGGAVLLFAAIVTIIEFPCTAFFPVLFTGILAEADIPFSLSLLYIGIYVFFYMLDEVAILLIAASTMKIWVASPRFSVIVNLFASLLLFSLGCYYLFILL